MDGCDHKNLSDSVVTQALGEELRLLRERAGWTRADLAERMNSQVSVSTLGTYERGARQCTVVRFVELSSVLGMTPEDVLNIALRRAAAALRATKLQIDLQSITRDTRPGFEPIRRWAAHRLTGSPEPPIAYLDQANVEDMASLAGCTHSELAEYLSTFAS